LPRVFEANVIAIFTSNFVHDLIGDSPSIKALAVFQNQIRICSSGLHSFVELAGIVQPTFVSTDALEMQGQLTTICAPQPSWTEATDKISLLPTPHAAHVV
jgi:hypothetical protein